MIWNPNDFPELSRAVLSGGSNSSYCLCYHLVTEKVNPVLGVHWGIVSYYIRYMYPYLFPPLKSAVYYFGDLQGKGGVVSSYRIITIVVRGGYGSWDFDKGILGGGIWGLGWVLGVTDPCREGISLHPKVGHGG